MCTVILMTLPGSGMVIAANRDERLDRPSMGWHDWGNGVFAPKDLILGGTWIGVNKHTGLVAALTNKDAIKHEKGKKSRGQLLLNVLLADNPMDVIRKEKPEDHNGFHLIFGTPDGMILISNENRSRFLLKNLDLQEITVVTGYGFEENHCERAKNIKFRVQMMQTHPPISMIKRVDSLLRFHSLEWVRYNGSEPVNKREIDDPRAACCIHNKDESHKTISSSLIFCNENSFEIWERNGFACESEFTTKHVVPICQSYVQEKRLEDSP